MVTSVSCTSATFCVAAGDYLDLASNAQALVSTWNGTSWTDQEVGAALNTHGNAGLYGVSCTSTTFCVAAGSYSDSASHSQALVSTWNGTSWTDQEVGAALNAGGNAVLDGVSCVKGALCVTGATTKTAPVDRPSSAP
ncbi:MAG: hypothetical protein HKL87_04285 [Acidimicrobiaceae bacterium]|nr:hypothetical protein [Acidimicrobiaceae bacterium]